MEEREHVVFLEFGAAFEEVELDGEADASDLAAKLAPPSSSARAAPPALPLPAEPLSSCTRAFAPLSELSGAESPVP
jgi:hypothetical protein